VPSSDAVFGCRRVAGGPCLGQPALTHSLVHSSCPLPPRSGSACCLRCSCNGTPVHLIQYCRHLSRWISGVLATVVLFDRLYRQFEQHGCMAIAGATSDLCAGTRQAGALRASASATACVSPRVMRSHELPSDERGAADMVENTERGSLTAGTPGWVDDGGCFLLSNTPLTILPAPPGDRHALGPAKSGKRVSALLGAGEAARLRLSGGGSVSPIPSPSAVLLHGRTSDARPRRRERRS